MATSEEIKAAKDATDQAKEAVAKLEAALKSKSTEPDFEAVKDMFGMGEKK